MGKQHLMGSNYFFKCYKDFKGHDIDYVVFEESPSDYINVKNIRGQGQDIFFWRKMSPSEFIEVTLNSGTPMQLGKFLIPEVCEELGFTIEDLKKLEPLLEQLDKKHTYEKLIFKSYIRNNEFSLSGEQLDAAYKEYKRQRPDIYK